MIKVEVSSWNKGKHDPRGKGYGIRIGKRNRILFERHWKNIELSIVGRNPIEVAITSGFWKDCPEVRDERIGK